MATQSPEANQLALKIEALRALNAERIKALTGDIRAMRESIHDVAGADSINLNEPIHFESIIEWSSGEAVLSFFLAVIIDQIPSYGLNLRVSKSVKNH